MGIENGVNAPLEESFKERSMLARRDHIVHQIPIDETIDIYKIEDPRTIETLHEFPTLVYLLGSVTQPLFTDVGVDGSKRPVRLITRGSGMFGLNDPDDAFTWSGINNHTLGVTRQVSILSTYLSQMPQEMREKFSEIGYDIMTLDTLNPYLLVDTMLPSHCGRREADEIKLYSHLLDENDNAHQESDPGLATLRQLKLAHAPDAIIDLMRVESHEYLAGEIMRDGIIKNFENIALTIPDWMFGQEPIKLEERFQGLQKSKRVPEATLKLLKAGALGFQRDFEEITGQELFELMTNATPPDWEVRIRETYCSPSGLDPRSTFPDFYEQFPQLVK